jgi:hypothetical protein
MRKSGLRMVGFSSNTQAIKAAEVMSHVVGNADFVMFPITCDLMIRRVAKKMQAVGMHP